MYFESAPREGTVDASPPVVPPLEAPLAGLSAGAPPAENLHPEPLVYSDILNPAAIERPTRDTQPPSTMLAPLSAYVRTGDDENSGELLPSGSGDDPPSDDLPPATVDLPPPPPPTDTPPPAGDADDSLPEDETWRRRMNIPQGIGRFTELPPPEGLVEELETVELCRRMFDRVAGRYSAYTDEVTVDGVTTKHIELSYVNERRTWGAVAVVGENATDITFSAVDATGDLVQGLTHRYYVDPQGSVRRSDVDNFKREDVSEVGALPTTETVRQTRQAEADRTTLQGYMREAGNDDPLVSPAEMRYVSGIITEAAEPPAVSFDELMDIAVVREEHAASHPVDHAGSQAGAEELRRVIDRYRADHGQIPWRMDDAETKTRLETTVGAMPSGEPYLQISFNRPVNIIEALTIRAQVGDDVGFETVRQSRVVSGISFAVDGGLLRVDTSTIVIGPVGNILAVTGQVDSSRYWGDLLEVWRLRNFLRKPRRGRT